MEALKSAAAQWSPADWKHRLPKLTPLEISELIPLAAKETNPDNWKDLLAAAFHSLEDKASLEALGSAIDTAQFIEILSLAGSRHKNEAEKLTSLLVTLSPAVFKETLAHAGSKALELLKGETFGEPLLHHLTLLVREIDNDIEQAAIEAVRFGDELETLDLTALNTARSNALFSSIDQMAAQTQQVIEILQNAQRLAWVADRADLIDDLSKAKDRAHKTLLYIAGDGEADFATPQNLHSHLKKKINALFSNADDQGGVTFMHDEQPALDAIVKFSVWYLNDYEEIGILPRGSMRKLENARNEEEKQAIRKALFDEASANLSKAGLNTLHDLKQARLFSKAALKEYLS